MMTPSEVPAALLLALLGWCLAGDVVGWVVSETTSSPEMLNPSRGLRTKGVSNRAG